MSKISTIINGLIRRSHWYNEVLFPNCSKFLTGQSFNQDVVNLGSTSALKAFNYEGLGINASNWAMSPQSFVNDYAILTNYSSYLKNGANVIITLCPFSSLGGGYDYFPDKYYTIVRPISIPNASLRKRDEVRAMQLNPSRVYTFWGFFYDLKSMFKKKEHYLSEDELKRDAKIWINNWLKEFSMYKIDEVPSLINRDRIEDSRSALSDIIRYCESHGFTPTIVLPPVSRHLAAMLPEDMRNLYIYEFLSPLLNGNVKFLDYINDAEFIDDSLYSTAFTLNKQGSKLFTLRVLKDIKAI